MTTPRGFVRSPFWGFAAFAAFWGVWGASIPRVRDVAGVSDGELGVALLFVGAGALPSMFLTGRALDRWGLWLTGPLLLLLGLAGAFVALVAPGGFVPLCVGLTLVGATSGASDVALNSLAGRAEQRASRPVITKAHATFSAVVVVAILATGALNAVGAPLLVVFGLVVVVAAIVCAAVVRVARPDLVHGVEPRVDVPRTHMGLSIAVLAGIGVLGALAFAEENAFQSWSAVFLQDQLSAPVGLTALGPAVFATVVSVTRFSISRVHPQHARVLLATGAGLATTGSATFAFAPSMPLALVALAVAAAGAAALFPTLMGIVSRSVPEERRARTTSTVTIIAYSGFLAGPAYVGLIAQTAGLRGAMIAVAALTAVMLVLIPIVLRGQATGAVDPRTNEALGADR